MLNTPLDQPLEHETLANDHLAPGNPPRFLLGTSQEAAGTSSGSTAVLQLVHDSAPASSFPAAITASGPAPSHLPSGWSLTGSVSSAGQLTIGCEVTGDVKVEGPGELVIEEGGSVKGTAVGRTIVVRGRMMGDIDATGGLVCIEAAAQIDGSVRYSEIEMLGGQHQMHLKYVAPAA